MPPKQPEIRAEEVRNPGVSYEPSQPDLRVVLGFLAALGLAAILVLLVLWGMFVYFRGLSAQRGALPSPRMYTSPPQVPQPQLQPDPVADYNVYRLSADEDAEQLRLGGPAGGHHSHSHRPRHGAWWPSAGCRGRRPEPVRRRPRPIQIRQPERCREQRGERKSSERYSSTILMIADRDQPRELDQGCV